MKRASGAAGKCVGRCHAAKAVALLLAATALLGTSTRVDGDTPNVREHSRSLRPALATDLLYKKVLDLRPLLKLMGNSDFSRIFDEPVWVGGSEVLAHANLGDGYLIGEYRLNLRTGKARLFGMNPSINDCKPAHWALSPDRKRLLWLQGHLDGDFKIISARVDGSDSESWKTDVRSDDCRLIWMPDGHRFVCLQRIYGDDVSRFVRVMIYDSAAPHRQPVVIGLPKASSFAQILGFLNDGTLLIAEDSSSTDLVMLLTSFRIDASEKDLTRHPVKWPTIGGKLTGVCLSHTGRSLAWIFTQDSDKAKDTLWISRADGSGMRRIGTTHGDLKAWYPNDRALLFEVDNFDSRPRKMELYRVALK